MPPRNGLFLGLDANGDNDRRERRDARHGYSGRCSFIMTLASKGIGVRVLYLSVKAACERATAQFLV